MSKILIAALIFAICAGCRRPMTSSTHVPMWSPPSGGLRARLIAGPAQGRVRVGESISIGIELENIGSVPLRVVLDDPFAFTAKIEDTSGRELSSTRSRLEVLSSPRVETIASGQTVRSPLTTPHEDAKMELDLTTSMWQLAPGRYRLYGHFTGSGAESTWMGTLDLPAIMIEVL